MFTKSLRIIKNGAVVLETGITLILAKPHLFFPDDTFILFGSKEIEEEFSIPKRSEVYIDDTLMGYSGASGTMSIKSDRFTGVLHALYLN